MTEYWPANWKVADGFDDVEPLWTADGWSPILVPVEALPSGRGTAPEAGALRSATKGRGEPEERFSYREAQSVSQGVRVVAKAALDRASADLGIRLPRLRFFNSEHKNVGGLARPGPWEVWLSAAVGPSEAVRTVAHEVRHLWQYERDWPPESQPGACDGDAERYAANFWRRYQYSPCLTGCLALDAQEASRAAA